ncbi:MAG: AIR synthase related protein, partial [Bacteroidales bacterium]|nr:AIR synthase related protein [Bacteroidales bacterium]
MTEDVNKKLTTPKGKVAIEEYFKEKFPHFGNASTEKVVASAMVLANENKETKTLFASKLFIENIHFDLTYFPLKHLGYKMATIAVSDIVAMNGTPTGISISLGVSNRFSMEALEELMGGVRIFCNIYKIDLLQFEVNTSIMGMVASVSAMGEVKSSDMLTNKGAKENDLLCVSGDLASAYTGLLLLEREKK